ncbi:type I polyketide synthase [Streptomyces sp. A1277]|uniref:type I polyketide synthase n=1 Tax=Streptomyces sp. A1277 TaxID=2563103 RepID=UPI001F0D9D2D|nr:type I polyketide synthase [Streptomyces sp. A1277]
MDQEIRRQFEAAQETLRQQHRMLGQFLLEKYEPVAVVGVGMRLPGGNDSMDDLDAFLREGRSGIGPLPRDRWAGEVDESLITAAAGGFLDAVDEFDAQFFNIPPKQAPYIDPAQRLMLETSWEALENAGIDPAALRHGDGGVYVGASPLDFALELEQLADEQLDGSLTTGLGGYSMSGRLSYFLGWRGPSLTTDTACASSLTALHLAVEGLRRRECSIALCAAANALHNPRSFVILSHGQFLAPDGHCKTFDDSADGYARAEGCGALVLKRLSDALMDGDNVLALVRGTAIGQDGESAGLSAPNGTAQEAVMRAALANARLEPGDIQYVEAHGTGTPLGDPIEIGSINGVFGASHSPDDPLTVGSLKANIGHMEPAAGLGAVIKVIAQMRAGVFYPHRWRDLSGRIPWDSYPLTVPDATRPWQAPVRRATVNGFGVAGAIAVAVLEEPPAAVPAELTRQDTTGRTDRTAQPATREPRRTDPAGHVFTLSAKSRPALRLQAERHLRLLAEQPGTSLADLCRTRATGRSHFRHRHAATVTDTEQLAARLRAWAEPQQPGDETGTTGPGAFRKVAFLFTGSGAQYTGMGRSLYASSPEFRRHVDACDALFTAHLGRSAAAVMFGEVPDAAEMLARTPYTHAALFTLEYALAQLWLSWGVRPSVLIGHSVGEIAAATVAGLFTLADGIAFLTARAALIESVSRPGGMAAVSAPAREVAPLLAAWSDLAVAADNAPQQCVVSGATASLDAAVAALRERGWNVTPLRVAAPFHSPLMAEVSEQLGKALASVEFHEPRLPLVSNLTGRIATYAELATADYWIRHVNETVAFAEGVRTIDTRGRHVFVEVGPSSALTSLARQCVDPARHRWLSCLSRKDETGIRLTTALAGAYTAGLNIAWSRVYADRPGRRIELPPYAFDRRPYRLPAPSGHRTAADGTHPLLGRPTTPGGSPAAAVRTFAARISATRPGYLADHTAAGRAFLPAAAYLELLLALQDELAGDTRRALEDIRFHEALFLTDRPALLLTRATAAADGSFTVEVHSRPAGDDTTPPTLHASAVIAAPDPTQSVGALTGTGRELLDRLAQTDIAGPGGPPPRQVLTGEEVRAAYARAGLDYGPQFSRATEVRAYGEDFALTTISNAGTSRAEHLPPPVLDAATHGLAAFADDGRSYIATRIARLRAFKKPRGEHLHSLLRIHRGDTPPAAFSLDVVLLDGAPGPRPGTPTGPHPGTPTGPHPGPYPGGEPVMELAGMTFALLPSRPAPPAGRSAGGAPVRPAAVSVDPHALAHAAPGERHAALVELLRALTADLLSITDRRDVDATATFLELGVDSLTATAMKNRLQDQLGLALEFSVVFDHPSVSELAGHLAALLTTAHPTPATPA